MSSSLVPCLALRRARANHIDPEGLNIESYFLNQNSHVIGSVFERCLFCCRHRSARAYYDYLRALLSAEI